MKKLLIILTLLSGTVWAVPKKPSKHTKEETISGFNGKQWRRDGDGLLMRTPEYSLWCLHEPARQERAIQEAIEQARRRREQREERARRRKIAMLEIILSLPPTEQDSLLPLHRENGIVVLAESDEI